MHGNRWVGIGQKMHWFYEGDVPMQVEYLKILINTNSEYLYYIYYMHLNMLNVLNQEITDERAEHSYYWSEEKTKVERERKNRG